MSTTKNKWRRTQIQFLAEFGLADQQPVGRWARTREY